MMQLEALFNAVPERLPIYVSPADDEALDSWIERTAAANGLTRPQMTRLLVGANREATTAFLTTKPDPRLVERLSGLTGETPEEIYRHTLMRFDGGLPLYLDKLDPRRHHTLRDVQPQGWFPGRTTQACPRCLAECGYWRIQWRLAHLAVCPEHGCYLVTDCDSCGRGLRDNGGRALKGHLANPAKCGNPTGTKHPCAASLRRIATTQAPLYERQVAVTVNTCLFLTHPYATGAVEFLDEVRAVAGLLCHIAIATPDPLGQEWESELLATETRGPGGRSRRWSTSPPRSAAIRGGLMSTALGVIQSGTVARSWVSRVPTCGEGPRVWIRDRSFSSRTVRRLLGMVR